MKLVRKARANLFPVTVVAAYLLLFIFRPSIGVDSLKNSVYYIKEMLMIMPVIIVLTALLDAWVPKEQIMRYLGKSAGFKGAVFSLLLGSISAGPIYAAFPLCVMLHKKGASLRNLVVILSAWAVIKVPMLLNEMKFLGFRFMAVRWVLTVLAILIFSWITAKLVKDSDLPAGEPRKTASCAVNRSACMGCGLCARKWPEQFGMENGKAYCKDTPNVPHADTMKTAAEACPVRAIVAEVPE